MIHTSKTHNDPVRKRSMTWKERGMGNELKWVHGYLVDDGQREGKESEKFEGNQP